MVRDPFAGSGTTGEAALREGFDCILMEAEHDYTQFLTQRFRNIKLENQVSGEYEDEDDPLLALLG